MTNNEIYPGIYYIGIRDWDRKLFDELIPLPDGTSYNSYVVRGNEKTALIDTADPPKVQELLDELRAIGVNKIDYVISNHAEQDHSGSIPMILDHYPSAKVVTNQKCASMLKDHLHIPEERLKVVADKEIISLGDRHLEFHLAPWVHWPETMFTYLKEDKILFTCDFFGSHLATTQTFSEERLSYNAAKRYYAEIMMPFRQMVDRNLTLAKNLNPMIVAPSHGPVYNDPKWIFDAYSEWNSDKYKNAVMIAYVSMHGSTKRMVDYLTSKIEHSGIEVKPYNLATADLGHIAMDLVDTPTLIVAGPTVLMGPHPLLIFGTFVVNALRPKLKYATIIGSYGWNEGTVETLKGMLKNFNGELLAPVMLKGLPTKEGEKALDALAEEIISKHESSNFFR